jgi:hypothetical protein
MQFNPPSAVRTTLYVTSVALNAMMGVILTSEVEVSVYVLAGIAGFNAVVALMAGLNVTPDQE